jgi:hypothetical protein
MKRTMLLIVITILACAVQAAAQGSKAAKPGDEQKRIGYFAGTWRLVATTRATSLTSPGKLTITESNQWMPGGFHLMSRSAHQAPAGDVFGNRRSSTAVRGYDAADAMYTYDAFFSMGLSEHCRGSVAGDTWTFTCPRKINGETIETRYTAKEISPTAYTFKVEITSGTGSGSVVMEGKATKLKKGH